MRKKKIYTLGICNDETSSVCFFINGLLVSAVSEERFSRKKHDNSFPKKSINYVLGNSNINLRDVHQIAYSWGKGFDKNLISLYEERAQQLKKNKKGLKIFNERIKHEKKRDKRKINEFKKWAKKNLSKKQNKNLLTFYHHESHAASAALFSPFEKGIVLTCDGRGDYESLTLSIFNRKEKNCLKKIYSATSSDSLGFFYGRITGLLGFKPMKHEGKITGLAAHGNPKKAIKLMHKMITVKKGKLFANLGDYYRPFFSPYSNKLKKEIKKYSREDIAAAAQYHLEWCLSEILKYNFKKKNFPPMNLMLAGGTFGNVKVNQILKSLKFIKHIFVQPQMGDGGLCLGAASLYLHKKKYKINQLKHLYLGPETKIYNLKQLKKISGKVKIDKPRFIKDKICSDLYNNKVIGLVRGKMEFGPRALCNRSIIYKTTDKSINDWLNKRLERTEFMPFAPVIRRELCRRAFKNFSKKDISLNFMTSTIDCTKEFAKKNPAVTHVDQTARPQVVNRLQDPFLWSLLKKWENKSKEMSLVNTSFNVHEEPIICSESESIKALLKGVIDVLYVEEYRITVK
jgi:carbamoyltransferase